jgi:uncharacterized protein
MVERNDMRLVLSTLFLTMVAAVAYAQLPPAIPDTFIQDHANVLTAEQRGALNQKVHQLDGKHIQLGVLTVQTTNGQDIAEFALNAGRTYGIGAKDGEHRGLLITLAIADHKSNIQVSRHLEGYINDGQTGEILRGLRPALRSGDYNTALNSAVDQLLALSANVPESEAQDVVADQPKKEETSEAWWLLLVLPLGLIGGAVALVFRRRKTITPQPTVTPRIYYPTAPIYTTTQDAPRARPQTQSEPQRKTEYVPVPTPTYTPTYEPPSSSYDSSSSSSYDSGGSFGGSSDFGGGGGSDSW